MKPLTTLIYSLAACTLASAQQQPSTQDHPTIRGLSLFEKVEYDAPGDGRLWARGKTYKASFGPEGASYIPFLGSQAPRNMPVRMRLAEASLGGVPIELEPEAQWSRQGDTVVLDRGAVDVHYLMTTESVEQTFVFDSIDRQGDLDVRVAVDSELAPSADGQGFRFSGELGGVNYGSATVYDGAGRRLALESKLEQGEIAIHVPRSFLQEAVLPIVVDPVITTYAVAEDPVSAKDGDVCYDASSGYYLYTYTYYFSANDWDVFALAVDENGAAVVGQGAYIDMTDTKWSQPAVANNNGANNCMVVAVAEVNGISQIWGRIRNLPGISLGQQVQVSPNSQYHCNSPSIGGEATDDGSDLYCVVWRKAYPNVETHIRYRTMDTAGLQVGPSMAIDDKPLAMNYYPKVSKSCGTGSDLERRWNIVWERVEGGGDPDIWGAQISCLGNIVTPTFPVDTTPDNQTRPQVSAPLDSPTGGKRNFLVVYAVSDGMESAIGARLFKENGYQASFNVTELEAELIGNGFLDRNQYSPSIGTDGTQFVISYVESDGIYSANIYTCSLRQQGSALIATEAHQLVLNDQDDLASPQVATQHDAGQAGSRGAGLAFDVYRGAGQWAVLGACYETPENWGLLGETACFGEPNSTGAPANFRAYGSADPDDNRLVLDVHNLPTFSWGQFIMSSSTQSFPLGNGTLCLGQPLMRLNTTFGNSWTNGALGSELDLDSLPGGTVVQGGQTWYLQFWYRDAGSTNFSNAEAVTFE